MSSVSIRSVAAADAGAVAALVSALGYPSTPGDIERRVATMRDGTGISVVVAELNGAIVGLATGHVFNSIHSTPPVAWLTTLVVASAAQRRGVGRQLVAAVEAWAVEHGAVRISVTSGLHRDDAHEFYAILGYERSGVRLTKRLVARGMDAT